MTDTKKSILRKIPSVDSLLNDPALNDVLKVTPRKIVVCLVREAVETVRESFVEHLQVDVWITMPRKADIANLAGLLGSNQGLKGAIGAEDPVRVSHADDLVELH